MTYSKSAVDKEIAKDKRIKGREAKMIHALLKGRQKTDEPKAEKFIAYDINDEVHGTFNTKKEAMDFALARNREQGNALSISNKLWVR